MLVSEATKPDLLFSEIREKERVFKKKYISRNPLGPETLEVVAQSAQVSAGSCSSTAALSPTTPSRLELGLVDVARGSEALFTLIGSAPEALLRSHWSEGGGLWTAHSGA